MPIENESGWPITLAKKNITEIDGHPVETPVDVVFRLLPFPTVVIEAAGLPSIVLAKERFAITLDSGAELEALVRSNKTGRGEAP